MNTAPTGQNQSVGGQDHWQQGWDDVRTVAFWVWAAVAFLAAPSLGTVYTVLTSGPKAGIDEARQLWQVFLLAFPLSLGVAIDSAVLHLLLRSSVWRQKADVKALSVDPSDMRGLFVVLTLVFFVSAYIGNRLGMGVAPVSMPQNEIKGSIEMRLLYSLLQLLGNYFLLYGPQLFVSAVVVGLFMGWAVAIKLIPTILAEFMPQERMMLIQAQEGAKLRLLLLADLHNVNLRHRYLAVRTAWQQIVDGGIAFRLSLIAVSLVLGVGLGPILTRTSENALLKIVGPNGMSVILGILIPVATVWVLNGGLTGDDSRNRRMKIQMELGPLPFNIPLNLEATRKRFLPGNDADEKSVIHQPTETASNAPKPQLNAKVPCVSDRPFFTQQQKARIGGAALAGAVSMAIVAFAVTGSTSIKTGEAVGPGGGAVVGLVGGIFAMIIMGSVFLGGRHYRTEIQTSVFTITLICGCGGGALCGAIVCAVGSRVVGVIMTLFIGAIVGVAGQMAVIILYEKSN